MTSRQGTRKKKRDAGNDDDGYLCPAIKHYIQTHTFHVWKTQTDTLLNVPVAFELHMKSASNQKQIWSLVSSFVSWVASLQWSIPLTKRLSIVLYLTPLKKVWHPHQEREITPCQMNSGQTEFYSNGERRISIWRREDFHKVLLHELLHAFDWDRLVPAGSKEAEAVVEAMANLLHVEWIHKTTGRWIMKEEQRHMHQQAMLLWMSRQTWTSPNTHVFEYCILKAALLFDDVAIRMFQTWLALPTVHSCRKQWPNLAKTSLERLIQSFPQTKLVLPPTVSLSLVTEQIPLSS